MKNKGFTVLELLVVIAIIGFVSTITYAVLSQARNNGKWAAVKEEMHQVKTEAEVFYAKNKSYRDSLGETICAQRFQVAIMPLIDMSVGFAECAVSPDGQAFGLEISRDGNLFWCTDSTGYVGKSILPPAGNRVCSTGGNQPLCAGSPPRFKCDHL